MKLLKRVKWSVSAIFKIKEYNGRLNLDRKHQINTNPRMILFVEDQLILYKVSTVYFAVYQGLIFVYHCVKIGPR